MGTKEKFLSETTRFLYFCLEFVISKFGPVLSFVWRFGNTRTWMDCSENKISSLEINDLPEELLLAVFRQVDVFSQKKLRR